MQQELLAHTRELSDQQQKSQVQFAELERLRQYVEGIGELLETRVDAAEKVVAMMAEVEKRTEGSHTTRLHTSAAKC